jgi:hypothetical protein
VSDLGPERLYGLLPEILRYRDAEEGQGLRAFLAVFDQEYAAIEQSIAALYDDWFVETCADWLLPYIGDLVGVRSSTLAHALTSRAFVGRALHYRRRKGTPNALAGAASDATGWPALAIPSYSLLAATQSMLDLHHGRCGTVDLRRLVGGRLSRFGGPFDTICRGVQVGSGTPLAGTVSLSLAGDRGRYGLERIGLFFWRLVSFPVARATARQVGAGTYTCHPFGIDAPLFNPPRRRDGLPCEALLPIQLDSTTLDAEAEVLARRERVETGGGVLAPEPALEIGVYYGGTTGAAQRIPPEAMLFCDLSTWRRPPTSVSLPGGGGERAIHVAVDPALGRIAFPNGIDVRGLEVSYAYAFAAALGGGPYARQIGEAGRTTDWWAEVGAASFQPAAEETNGAAGPARFATLAEALAAWNDAARGNGDAPAKRAGRILIASDDICLAPSPLAIELATSEGRGRRLEIVAAPGRRPCLAGDLLARGPAPRANDQELSAALSIDGLWIDGAVSLSGNVASFVLAHCTLFPKRRTALSFSGAAPSSLEVAVRSSIVGAIRLPAEGCRLDVTDSIVDAAGAAQAIGGELGAEIADLPGPISWLKQSTIFGEAHLIELDLASEMLFVGKVEVQRCSRGLVRRSYLPPGSTTPHRTSMVPDDTPPTFTSRVYGQPGYAQLAPNCAHPIALGPYGELGVFHSLRQPARLALLPEIAAEFLPWGLEAEIIFAT